MSMTEKAIIEQAKGLRPTRNQVIIMTPQPSDITPAGIHIPEVVHKNKAATHGRVMALGPKCEEGLEIGDLVYFEKFGARRFQGFNGRIVIIRENEIYAKEEEKEDEADSRG